MYQLSVVLQNHVQMRLAEVVEEQVQKLAASVTDVMSMVEADLEEAVRAYRYTFFSILLGMLCNSTHHCYCGTETHFDTPLTSSNETQRC